MKLKKAWKDLVSNPGRMLLVLAALIIGLWGFGSVASSYVILSNDLSENFIKTQPAQAVFEVESISNQIVNDLVNQSEVESAELRSFALLRIETHPDEWIPLWLFGVEDFNSMGIAKIDQEEGAEVPTKGTMLIERNGLLISDLKIGANARIRSGSENLSVPVSGITFDPGQAPATQDHFIYAYVDEETFTQLTGLPNNKRLIVRFKDVNSTEDVEKSAEKLKRFLADEGVIVNKVQVPKLNEHPHQWQLNTLLLVFGSIGFIAFLLSAILVVQLIGAMLGQHVRQIGILKAVGGSTGQIASIYLRMLLILGTLTAAFAIPLSLITGYAYANFVAGILNFKILTTTLPPYLYILLLGVSILFPIVLSLRVVLKAVNVSVLEALGDFGVKIGKGHSKTSKFLKPRVIVVILAMALGIAIFNTGFNVRQSLDQLVKNVDDSLRYDIQVVLSDQISQEEGSKIFESLTNVETIEFWNGGTGEIQGKAISTDNKIGIISAPFDTKLLQLKMIEGRWISGKGTNEMVINQQAISTFGKPQIGDDIQLMIKGQPLLVKLVGIAENFDPPKIYLDNITYDLVANKEHLANSLMFVGKQQDYSEVMQLKKEIEKIIEDSNLNVIYVMSQAERVKIVVDHLNIILTSILFLAFLVLLVSALGMSSALGINIMERTREIGVMRAIGATPNKIMNLFIKEGMFISIFAVFIGVLLSQPLSKVASIFFGNLLLGDESVLSYAFSVQGLIITVVTTIIFGYFASRVPARNAIKLSTAKALNYI